jgi:hypothetical protein
MSGADQGPGDEAEPVRKEAEPVRTEGQASSTQHVRPATRGGLEAAPRAGTDYRNDLRSRRWDAAPLRNPEVEKTDPRIAVAFIALLAAITLIVLVLGYASGVWQLPA